MPKSFSDLPPVVQVVVLGGAALVLAGGAFWYYVLPLSDQRDKLDKQVSSLHAQNVKNLAFEQERTEYLNRIAQLERQVETLRSIVPDEQATEQFMRMVAGTATAAGINVRTFVAQPPEEIASVPASRVRRDVRENDWRARTPVVLSTDRKPSVMMCRP